MKLWYLKMTNYNKLCRACLTSLDSSNYKFNENVSPEDYLFCTSVEIIINDDLPKMICDVCYDLMTKLVEFKKACIHSNDILLACTTIKLENDFVEKNNGVSKSDIGIRDCLDDESIKDAFGNDSNSNNAVIIKWEEPKNIDDGSDDSMVFADLAPTVCVKKEDGHKRTLSKAQNPASQKKRKKYTCEICDKKFVSFDRCKVHRETHENKIAPKCVPCNKSFVSCSGLRRHNANWHSKVKLKNFKCRTCGKIAMSRETLAAHEKRHGDRSQFICNICGKGYTTKTNLEGHLETHKDNRERQFTCDLCGKKFLTKPCLISHISRCHTGKRFICEVCSVAFTVKYNLVKHLQNHEGIKDFTCKVCDKAFTTKYSFREHERTHSGERPFQCKYCPKTFISKKRVNDHHRTHTGEKPHKCNVCNHLFTQRGSLTRHMKIHVRTPF